MLLFLLGLGAAGGLSAGVVAATTTTATTAVLHWSVVSKAVVERCHALGTPVLAWTVDDPALLRRLDSMGVDGVITNDPRIFGG